MQPLDELQKLWDWSRDGRASPCTCDGARIWNAARRRRASTLATYGRLADTASVCLSKGLGAPVGSVLVGLGRADRRRRGCCASGSAAACARPASSPRPACTRCDHHLERLAEDHEHARLLAERLGRRPVGGRDQHRRAGRRRPRRWSPRRPRRRACWSARSSPRRLRLVTHLDVDRAGIDRAADVLARTPAERLSRSRVAAAAECGRQPVAGRAQAAADRARRRLSSGDVARRGRRTASRRARSASPRPPGRRPSTGGRAARANGGRPDRALRRSSSCRSRLEPHSSSESLACTSPSRSGPTAASSASSVAVIPPGAARSCPAAQAWQVSKQTPTSGWFSSAAR